MKVVYVIGPIIEKNAWEIEQNIRRAETIALAIWKMGAAVICMHASNRFYQGTMSEEDFLKGDLEVLSRCDAAFVLPAIWRSKGSQAEVELAEELMLPIFGNLPNLERWLRGDDD